MTGVQSAMLVILAICLGASGLFSGSETAFVALPRERIGQLAQRGKRGEYLGRLAGDLEGTLATLLVANNFVNILAASVAAILAVDLITALLDRTSGEAIGPWVSTIVLTAVILVVGEITPKTVAARRPEQFALLMAPGIWWLRKLLEPIARIFVGMSRRILRVLGIDTGPQPAATEEDILALALLSEQAGEIDPTEREILQSVFELADRPVRDVMTPRLEVVALEAGSPPEVARAAVASHGHSRFPIVVRGGTLDDLVGVLYVKDVLRLAGDSPTIDAFVREPVFIPESTSVLAALQVLRRERVSMGIVLDEHGGVDGLVTIKDLIAELVGEIQDEYDPREPSIFRLGDGVWVVEGRVPVEDLARELERELPEGPYSSVGGLFLWAAGRVTRCRRPGRCRRCRPHGAAHGPPPDPPPPGGVHRQPKQERRSPRGRVNLAATTMTALRDVAQFGSAQRSGR